MPKSSIELKTRETADLEGELEEQERGTWANHAEFLLSCLGYAVGLGNVWRFPYLCYVNGGGAFLIPYVVMLTFMGIPIFMLELSAGQFSGRGPLHVWSCAPLFQGIGAGMIFNFFGNIYYNVIIAWSIYYLYQSCSKILPWQGCEAEWHTTKCYSVLEAENCTKQGTEMVWFNTTCINNTLLSIEEYWQLSNATANRKSPAEEYFNIKVLARSDRMEDTGTVKWDLALALFIAWAMVFFCVVKGIKSSGKVVYFTATFPYLILVILFVRGLMLDGAMDGIRFYLVPRFERLSDPKVWIDAAGQIFFSLSVGTGGLMTFASYNKFKNNIYRDTMIVAIGNCLTSFFAGFVIFSILGFMAKELGKEVPDVVKSGSGLAFVAYPEIVTRMPLPQLWAFLFFFMLLMLGLDSEFAAIENLQTSILDMFPRLRRRKPLVSLAICSLFFLFGLLMCTNAGMFWFELTAYYTSGWLSALMGMAEVMAFSWAYGAIHMKRDIELMSGIELKVHWLVTWYVIAPIGLLVIMVWNLVKFKPLTIGDYTMPWFGQAYGWALFVYSLVLIPVGSLRQYWLSYKDPTYDGLNTFQRLRKLCKPTEAWFSRARRNGHFLSNDPSGGISPEDQTPEVASPESDASGLPPAYEGGKKPWEGGELNTAFLDVRL